MALRRLGSRLGVIRRACLYHQQAALVPEQSSDVLQTQPKPPPAVQAREQWPFFIERGAAQSALQEAPQAKSYKITVETGDVRGAGSKAPAMLQLIGENGTSLELPIGTDEEDRGFERGSTQSYSIDVDDDLGILRRCFVRQETEALDKEDATHGWFLHQVTVTDGDGQEWRFPCNSWIGDSDADGYEAGRERNLILCEDPSLQTSSRPVLPEPLRAVFGAVSVPHPEKVSKENIKAVNRQSEGWGGEDAYFCVAGRYGIVGMGVADGVYAWKERGIDAGLFSKTLMSRAKKEVDSGLDDVVRLMQATVEQTYADGIKGSSTACLVLVDTLHGRLTSANIGDSGFLVLGTSRQDQHEMELKYHSPQQEHQFGFPYQLGHHDGADSVDSAMLHTLPVGSGDVVILGSDGLWDNLSVHEISEKVKELTASDARPSIIAQTLAKLAFEHAVDKHAVTPYSQGASEAFDMIYNGGKQDDITVVVTRLS